MPEFTMFVPGTPAPGGSKKSFLNPKTGRIVTLDDCKRNGPWRDRVAHFARVAYHGNPLSGPLSVRMEFVVLRPKGHYRTGKNAAEVRASAPRWPAVKPDVLKLTRAVEDSLTGIVWRDDALIVREELAKDYGPTPGVRITVRELEDHAP